MGPARSFHRLLLLHYSALSCDGFWFLLNVSFFSINGRFFFLLFVNLMLILDKFRCVDGMQKKRGEKKIRYFIDFLWVPGLDWGKLYSFSIRAKLVFSFWKGFRLDAMFSWSSLMKVIWRKKCNTEVIILGFQGNGCSVLFRFLPLSCRYFVYCLLEIEQIGSRSCILECTKYRSVLAVSRHLLERESIKPKSFWQTINESNKNQSETKRIRKPQETICKSQITAACNWIDSIFVLLR